MPMSSHAQLLAVAAGAAAGAVVLWATRQTRRGAHSASRLRLMTPGPEAPSPSRLVLVRHGESVVNAEGGPAYYEAKFFDAPLSQAGQDMAAGPMRKTLEELLAADSPGRRRLILPSTLTRALETATLGLLPLLPPSETTTWKALDESREAMTVIVGDGEVPREDRAKPCNSRGAIAKAKLRFPHVDFSGCPEKDPLDQLETVAAFEQRIDRFLVWIKKYAERNGDAPLDVVVVCHYVFLRRLLWRLHCSGIEVGRTGMDNCEVRVLPLDALLALPCSNL
eukprot:CAMPEP_0179073218 /NCGR_PEP_ID=MMETSP0796-20121207/32458_1 /TAXON_ID=73915 /ORGANISM="Pyrodinium bahamense, Strain pbaha01" /LENGTH=279 /DNA_ID=CAMNT_0020770405 /DNA_START=24 /DNA_END=863 /DNA_ORIENTATION=+